MNDFMEINGIELVSTSDDECICIARISDSSLNYYGYVHGGLFYSLSDACAGYLARIGDDVYVTLNSSINYVTAAKEGIIEARGTVIKRTRKTCVIEIKTYNNDNLCTVGIFTMYHVER